MANENKESTNTISSLERARRHLYSIGNKTVTKREGIDGFSQKDSVNHDWNDAPLSNGPSMKKHRHVRIAALFFGSALVFFLVAVGSATYLLYFGGSSVSVNNVDVAISGPTTIDGGETLPLSFTITNRNPAAITGASLNVDFPEGTRSATNVLEDYSYLQEDLGTIAPGETVTRTVKAVVFGAEDSRLSIPVTLVFGTANSNSRFIKEASYDFSIVSSPLSLTVVAPTEAVSGQSFAITLAVRSNSTTPLSNVLIGATYPFGFSFASSSVPAQNNTFSLGTLAPGAERKVTLTGSLSGPNSEGRSFHFTVGTAATSGDPAIAIAYASREAQLILSAPFISSTLTVDGKRSDPVVLTPGTRSSATLSYTNTSGSSISNAQIEVQISGDAIDYDSILSTRGFYRSSDHTIVFSRETDASLSLLEPSGSGIGAFSFKTLPGTSSRSSAVTFTIAISGIRTGETNVPTRVSASRVVSARVKTATVLTAKTLHSSGPITNTGPIPPVANTPTTYTVQWEIANNGNSIADSTVSATLPNYITFTGVMSPAGGVTFNESTRKVTWTIGDLSAVASRKMAFQVSLTPSTSQRDGSPTLMSDSTFSGYDRFAGVNLSVIAGAISTQMPEESGYTPAQGSVQ